PRLEDLFARNDQATGIAVKGADVLQIGVDHVAVVEVAVFHRGHGPHAVVGKLPVAVDLHVLDAVPRPLVDMEDELHAVLAEGDALAPHLHVLVAVGAVVLLQPNLVEIHHRRVVAAADLAEEGAAGVGLRPQPFAADELVAGELHAFDFDLAALADAEDDAGVARLAALDELHVGVNAAHLAVAAEDRLAGGLVGLRVERHAAAQARDGIQLVILEVLGPLVADLLDRARELL